MKLQQSNIWQDADVLDYICITTNAKVKKTGELVMGRGVAKEAKEHEPMLPQLFGSMLLELGTVAQAVSIFVEFFMRYCFKLSTYPLIFILIIRLYIR